MSFKDFFRLRWRKPNIPEKELVALAKQSIDSKGKGRLKKTIDQISGADSLLEIINEGSTVAAFLALNKINSQKILAEILKGNSQKKVHEFAVVRLFGMPEISEPVLTDLKNNSVDEGIRQLAKIMLDAPDETERNRTIEELKRKEMAFGSKPLVVARVIMETETVSERVMLCMALEKSLLEEIMSD